MDLAITVLAQRAVSKAVVYVTLPTHFIADPANRARADRGDSTLRIPFTTFPLGDLAAGARPSVHLTIPLPDDGTYELSISANATPVSRQSPSGEFVDGLIGATWWMLQQGDTFRVTPNAPFYRADGSIDARWLPGIRPAPDSTKR